MLSPRAVSLKNLEKQLDAEEIGSIRFAQLTNFYSTISGFLKKPTNILEDIKALAHCILKYTDLVGIYYGNIAEIKESDARLMKRFCAVISNIPISQSIRDAYIQEISVSILEKVTDPAVTLLFARELLINFNTAVKHSKKELRHMIVASNKLKLCKLMDVMCVCGDYDHQINIMETVFRMCSPQQIKEYAYDLFPESKVLENEFLNIQRENFDSDSRTFLNILNLKFMNVLSLKCDCVLLSNIPIFSSQGLPENQLWVNFNRGSQSVSITCDKGSLEIARLCNNNCHGSRVHSLQSIIVNVSNVKQVLLSRLLVENSPYTEGSIISFYLNNMLEPLRTKRLKIVILGCPELEVLEKNVLPIMFNEKLKIILPSTPEMPQERVAVAVDTDNMGRPEKNIKSSFGHCKLTTNIPSPSTSNTSKLTPSTPEMPQERVSVAVNADNMRRPEKNIKSSFGHCKLTTNIPSPTTSNTSKLTPSTPEMPQERVSVGVDADNMRRPEKNIKSSFGQCKLTTNIPSPTTSHTSSLITKVCQHKDKHEDIYSSKLTLVSQRQNLPQLIPSKESVAAHAFRSSIGSTAVLANANYETHKSTEVENKELNCSNSTYFSPSVMDYIDLTADNEDFVVQNSADCIKESDDSFENNMSLLEDEKLQNKKIETKINEYKERGAIKATNKIASHNLSQTTPEIFQKVSVSIIGTAYEISASDDEDQNCSKEINSMVLENSDNFNTAEVSANNNIDINNTEQARERFNLASDSASTEYFTAQEMYSSIIPANQNSEPQLAENPLVNELSEKIDDVIEIKDDTSSASTCYLNYTRVDYVDLTSDEQNTSLQNNINMEQCDMEIVKKTTKQNGITENTHLTLDKPSSYEPVKRNVVKHLTKEIGDKSRIVESIDLTEDIEILSCQSGTSKTKDDLNWSTEKSDNNLKSVKSDHESNISLFEFSLVATESHSQHGSDNSQNLSLIQAGNVIVSRHDGQNYIISKWAAAGDENILGNIASQQMDENRNNKIAKDSEIVTTSTSKVSDKNEHETENTNYNDKEQINQVFQTDNDIDNLEDLRRHESMDPNLTPNTWFSQCQHFQPEFTGSMLKTLSNIVNSEESCCEDQASLYKDVQTHHAPSIEVEAPLCNEISEENKTRPSAIPDMKNIDNQPIVVLQRLSNTDIQMLKKKEPENVSNVLNSEESCFKDQLTILEHIDHLPSVKLKTEICNEPRKENESVLTLISVDNKASNKPIVLQQRPNPDEPNVSVDIIEEPKKNTILEDHLCPIKLGTQICTDTRKENESVSTPVSVDNKANNKSIVLQQTLNPDKPNVLEDIMGEPKKNIILEDHVCPIKLGTQICTETMKDNESVTTAIQKESNESTVLLQKQISDKPNVSEDNLDTPKKKTNLIKSNSETNDGNPMQDKDNSNFNHHAIKTKKRKVKEVNISSASIQKTVSSILSKPGERPINTSNELELAAELEAKQCKIVENNEIHDRYLSGNIANQNQINDNQSGPSGIINKKEADNKPSVDLEDIKRYKSLPTDLIMVANQNNSNDNAQHWYIDKSKIKSVKNVPVLYLKRTKDTENQLQDNLEFSKIASKVGESFSLQALETTMHSETVNSLNIQATASQTKEIVDTVSNSLAAIKEAAMPASTETEEQIDNGDIKECTSNPNESNRKEALLISNELENKNAQDELCEKAKSASHHNNKRYECKSEVTLSQRTPPKKRKSDFAKDFDQPIRKLTRSSMVRNKRNVKQTREPPKKSKWSKKRKLFNLNDTSYLEYYNENDFEAAAVPLKVITETSKSPSESIPIQTGVIGVEEPQQKIINNFEKSFISASENIKNYYRKQAESNEIEVDTSNIDKCIITDNKTLYAPNLQKTIDEQIGHNDDCGVMLHRRETKENKIPKRMSPRAKLHHNKKPFSNNVKKPLNDIGKGSKLLSDATEGELTEDEFDKILTPQQKNKSHELTMKTAMSSGTAATLTLHQNSRMQKDNKKNFESLMDCLMEKINCMNQSINKSKTLKKSSKIDRSRHQHKDIIMRQQTNGYESLCGDSIVAGTKKRKANTSKTRNITPRKPKRKKPVIQNIGLLPNQQNSSDFSQFPDLIVEKEKPREAKEVGLTDSDPVPPTAQAKSPKRQIIIHSNLLIKKPSENDIAVDTPQSKLYKPNTGRDVVLSPMVVIEDVTKIKNFTNNSQKEGTTSSHAIQDLPNSFIASQNLSIQDSDTTCKSAINLDVINQQILTWIATGLTKDSSEILKNISEATLRACAEVVKVHLEALRGNLHPSLINLHESLTKIDNIITSYFNNNSMF